MTHATGEAAVLPPDVLALLRQCQDCKATCCTYITVDIDDPEDDEDEWEAIRWYLTRPNTKVYVDEDGDWFLQIGERCQFLNDDNSCGNYDNRPKVCSDHDASDCEYWGDPEEEYIHVWNSFDEFDKYYKAEVKPRLEKEAAKAAAKRSRIARKAAKARWAKVKANGNGAAPRKRKTKGKAKR